VLLRGGLRPPSSVSGDERRTDPTVVARPYRTPDLDVAAYWTVAGVPLQGTERAGSRVTFVFEDTGNIGVLRTEYFARTAMVPAMSYADELKALKSMIYDH
jgi:hypothetical protein